LSCYILYWVPFYYAAKVLLLVLCMGPKYAGGTAVYDTVLRPGFLIIQRAAVVTVGAVEAVEAVEPPLADSPPKAHVQ
jgi:hypothetical protein